MNAIMIWRVVQVCGSLLAGVAGIVATHNQVKAGNKKRFDADEAYRRQVSEYLGIPTKTEVAETSEQVEES